MLSENESQETRPIDGYVSLASRHSLPESSSKEPRDSKKACPWGLPSVLPRKRSCFSGSRAEKATNRNSVRRGGLEPCDGVSDKFGAERACYVDHNDQHPSETGETHSVLPNNTCRLVAGHAAEFKHAPHHTLVERFFAVPPPTSSPPSCDPGVASAPVKAISSDLIPTPCKLLKSRGMWRNGGLSRGCPSEKKAGEEAEACSCTGVT